MTREVEPTQAPPTSGRILELDALRGIAALGVVFWHYGAHFHAYPLAGLLHPFYNAGFLLVDFFFVLSGYVIARAYWREPRQWNFYRNVWARVARLYPLHLLTLLATIMLVACLPDSANNPDFRPPTNDVKHLALNLVLLNQVGLQDGWSFNTPAWSISTEFVVNVAFLAFIALTARARIMTTALAAVVLLVLAIQHPGIRGNLALGYLDVNLLRCFLGFGGGVVVYWLVHRLHGDQRIAAIPKTAGMLGIASLLAMLGFLVMSGAHPPTWHYLVSIFIAMCCVAFVPLGPFSRRLLRKPPLVFLGDISYSTYLTHYPLQLALYSLTQYGLLQVDYRSPAVLGAYTAAVICVSTLTQKYVELPAQRSLIDYAARRAQMA